MFGNFLTMSGRESPRHREGDERQAGNAAAPLGFGLGGVRIEVDGRVAHDCDDTWDANWLSVTARCQAAGAQVVVPAAVMTSWSIERFCQGLEALARTGVGSAYLASELPNLTVRVESQKPDTPITVRAELTADSAGQGHWFAFAVTRAELEGVIGRCREILAVHPANQMAG
jgi:hypothetical protein